MNASIASSVRAVSLTLRCRLHCSTCSAVFPGGSFINGPSVSSSKNSLLVKVSNEHPKSGYVSPEFARSEEHTSELQSHSDLVCRLLLEKKKSQPTTHS